MNRGVFTALVLLLPIVCSIRIDVDINLNSDPKYPIVRSGFATVLERDFTVEGGANALSVTGVSVSPGTRAFFVVFTQDQLGMLNGKLMNEGDSVEDVVDICHVPSLIRFQMVDGDTVQRVILKSGLYTLAVLHCSRAVDEHVQARVELVNAMVVLPSLSHLPFNYVLTPFLSIIVWIAYLQLIPRVRSSMKGSTTVFRVVFLVCFGAQCVVVLLLINYSLYHLLGREVQAFTTISFIMMALRDCLLPMVLYMNSLGYGTIMTEISVRHLSNIIVVLSIYAMMKFGTAIQAGQNGIGQNQSNVLVYSLYLEIFIKLFTAIACLMALSVVQVQVNNTTISSNNPRIAHLYAHMIMARSYVLLLIVYCFAGTTASPSWEEIHNGWPMLFCHEALYYAIFSYITYFAQPTRRPLMETMHVIQAVLDKKKLEETALDPSRFDISPSPTNRNSNSRGNSRFRNVGAGIRQRLRRLRQQQSSRNVRSGENDESDTPGDNDARADSSEPLATSASFRFNSATGTGVDASNVNIEMSVLSTADNSGTNGGQGDRTDIVLSG